MYSKIVCRMSLVLALPGAMPHVVPGQPASSSGHPLQLTARDRTRVDAWQWFAAPPAHNSYGYVESLLRIGVGQQFHQWDWKLELSQAAILDAPGDAIGAGPGQGQLGLGATYYAVNGNSYPAPRRANRAMQDACTSIDAVEIRMRQAAQCRHFPGPPVRERQTV